MPSAGKKKKGRRKKKVPEEKRERKKLDKLDTKAMKYVSSLDMYAVFVRDILSWLTTNEKLVVRYFSVIPPPFPVDLLENYIKAIRPDYDEDEDLDNYEDGETEMLPHQKSVAYSVMSTFCKGLIDLGAPYTEMEMHIMCRIIQSKTSVSPPKSNETDDENATDDEQHIGQVGDREVTKTLVTQQSVASDGSTVSAAAPSLQNSPGLFQDLIVKVSSAVKSLQAEEKLTWQIVKSNIPLMMKTKERIPWVNSILELRKAAEAAKKKKKKKKKKRPKSAGPQFERCKTCNIILTDPYSGPSKSEYGFVRIMCRMASRDNVPKHPMHVTFTAQSHWLIAQIARTVIDRTDLATSEVVIYPTLPNLHSATNPLAVPLDNTKSLQDLGITGGPRLEPVDLTLYYDFKLPSIATRCPLLNAETLYDNTNKTYHENQLKYEIAFAKTHHKAEIAADDGEVSDTEGEEEDNGEDDVDTEDEKDDST